MVGFQRREQTASRGSLGRRAGEQKKHEQDLPVNHGSLIL